jgi:uncharacterized phosphosugar-binding protein
MTMPRWFTACDEILTRIRATQSDAIRRAAGLIAEAAKAGGGLHIYDTGHCSHEPIHRAGGLLMMTPLRFSFTVETRPAPRRGEVAARRHEEFRHSADEAIADLAVERSGLAPGDVLIVNSVSGKAASVVQVAVAAKRLGLSVVAITNVSYSNSVTGEHSSGKHLFEVADVVIDNCGVVGDAILEIEGVEAKVAPTSGLTFCYIIWALTCEAIDQMLARGLRPHVYQSINRPGGSEFDARAEAKYRETGV